MKKSLTAVALLALLALLGGSTWAQQPRPMNPPPQGRGRPPMEGGLAPGAPGEGPPRVRNNRPAPERGPATFSNNPPFGGGGPMRGGEPSGPGFRPGGPRPLEQQRLRQDDPEMYALVEQDQQLEQQTQELAEQLRRAASDQREKLKSQLAELVNKHFDVRQQRRALQLKRMEDELARLRDAIQQRHEARESIVKERLLELTGDPRDLGF